MGSKATAEAKQAPAPAPAAGGAKGRFAPIASDPAMKIYTDGVAALYRKEWDRAEELLGEIAGNSDIPELADRARQLLAAARQRAAESRGEAKAKAQAAEGEDPYLQALFIKNRGDLGQALEMCQKEGRDQKDERFAYLAAAIHASENRTDEAARALTRAIELNPKNRIHAYHDPDFAELRRNRDHRPLFGLS